MRLQLSLAHKGFILVAIPLIFEVVFVVVLFSLLDQSEQEAKREAHSRLVIQSVNVISQDIFKISQKSANRHSHLGISLERAQGLKKTLHDLHGRFEDLKTLVGSDPEQMGRVSRIQERFERMRPLADHLFAVAEEQPIQAMALFETVHKTLDDDVDQIVRLLWEISNAEQQVEQTSPEKQATVRAHVRTTLLVALLFNIGLAVGLAVYFNKAMLKRLSVLMDNSYRLAANRPLNPPLDGTDEIAHLDQVFSRMAESLTFAAARERALIDNCAEVICSIDSTNRFSSVSPACAQVWGWAPDRLLGNRLIEILYADDVKATAEAFAEVARKPEQEVMRIENRIVRSDGRVVDSHWSISWSPSQKLYFCVVQDVSERKRIERMKQDFVDMVSHDLRTPLTSMQAVLEMIDEGVYGDVSDRLHEVVRQSKGNINRLVGLVTDLLDIEKMESGMLELHRRPNSLGQIFARTRDALAGFAGHQGVKLEVDESELMVNADADRLVQVLVNLAGNGIKFSLKGGTVSISAQQLANEVEVRVRDEGRGIPSAKREMIFERFKQVQRADSTEKGGSGLGLAISKAIIEHHGGTIGVESEAGAGSTFWFRLPLEPEAGTAGSAAPDEALSAEQL